MESSDAVVAFCGADAIGETERRKRSSRRRHGALLGDLDMKTSLHIQRYQGWQDQWCREIGAGCRRATAITGMIETTT